MAAAVRVVYDIFIQRIPFTAGTRELRQYFQQFGQVKNCRMKLDKNTGFYSGVGWVKFSNHSAVQTVLEKDDHLLEGYKIKVQQHQTWSQGGQAAAEQAGV